MQYINAKIAVLAADLFGKMLSKGPSVNNITIDDFNEWLTDYQVVSGTNQVDLTMIRPDYEGIKQQLQQRLMQRDSWKDKITAAVGETLLDLIATIGSYSQLSIQRSLQEAFPRTAKLPSSIYEVTRMLGVHIDRKVPSSVTVTLTLKAEAGQITVPRLSQFEIAGTFFFNRDPIILQHGLNTQATLYQGQVNVSNYTSSGKTFQRFEIGNADFRIANEDVYVYNGSYANYTRSTDGIWNIAGGAYVFFESTTPNGNVELTFGNGLYGRLPSVGEVLNIVYILTDGAAANTTVSGLKATLVQINDVVPERVRADNATAATVLRTAMLANVTGQTLSGIDGGTDERETDLYRLLAPRLFAAKGRATTRADHFAIGLTFPKIADVLFQGQQELGPTNRNFTNVVGITPLHQEGRAFTESEFNALAAFIDNVGIWRCNYLHIPANPVSVRIAAKLFCPQGTDVNKVRTYVDYLLSNKFGIRQGSLGYSLYLNDIHAAIKANHFGLAVDYAELMAPTTDSIVTKTDFVTIAPPQLEIGFTDRTYVGYVPTKRS